MMEIIPGYTLGDERPISSSRTGYTAVSPAGRKVTVEVCRFRRQSLADLAVFKNEINIIRNIPGGCLVAIEDVIYRHDSVVVVYEEYDGVPLGIFFGEKPVPAAEALRAGIKISAALEMLHRHGVAHRNLNPLSILVERGLHSVRLTDPGILSLITRELDDISDPLVIRTRLGYISPEQTGRLMLTPDHRCDFYALGAVLYELLLGRPPFRASNALETIHAHLANRPLPVHEERPEVPRMVSDIVLKLLAKSPDDRYQTAYGLRVDLEECLNQVAETGMVHQFTAGAYDIPEKLVIPRKVYGRGEEIARLMTSFDRVRLGFPELVAVCGPDGAGKTSLVLELQDAVIRHRGSFIYGKFEEMKRHVPYSAFIQAFQSALRRVLAGSDAETEQWRKRLAEALGPGGRIIAEVIPEAGMLLGDPANLPEAGPEEARNRFNHAFQKFAMLFSGEESPLVLFLDDIHWADPASLSLITSLFREGGPKHFMLVAACREGADDAGDVDAGRLAGIGDPGVPVRVIRPGPLERNEISLLVGDTLHCGAARADALAETLLEKTGGIPIIVVQYLARLVEGGFLSHVPGAGWQWDDEAVRGLSVADNLAGLLADKIGGLGETVRRTLEWAACLGGAFDLEDLAEVSGGTLERTHDAVLSAMESGLVIKAAGQYRFAHDRISEVIYSRIGDGDRMRMRLAIGHYLLKKTSSGLLEERVFSIADHLNEGAPLITEQYDRIDLARLNLMAGIRAKRSAAYLSAVRYLSLGISLLPPESWRDTYELTHELFYEKMKCEYLSGNFREAEKLFTGVEANSRTRLDIARAYNIMIMLYTTTGRHAEAVRLGIRGLGMLGIRVPRNPSRARIIAGMLATRARLSGKNADRITKLPLMEDDVKRAACEILINMLPPAYYTDAGFMAFLVLRMVRLVLRHGNTEASPMIFVTYAAILGSAGKDSDTAYAVALGAMKLLDGAAGGKYRSKVNHVFGMTVNHWKRHARESIDYSLRAYRLGRESGDFMYAAHSVNIMTMTRIMLGDNLDDIFTDYRKYEDFLKRTGDPFAMGNYSDNFQMYLNLKGLTESRRSLNSHGYDETRRLAEVRKTGNLMELFFHLLTRVKTLFLAGEFEECLPLCEEMERIKRIPAGTLHTAEHCFYYSLALAACPGGPDRGRLRRMRKNRREMKRRAGACPDNFLHKLLLIDAEIARLSGDEAGAIRLYGMAIEAARSAGYLQNEAIAHERAALFFLEKGCRDIAGLYLELAFKCYLGWGADSKVYDLRERYATLRERPGSGAVSERRRQSDLSSLVDAEAMVKALLAISGEIVIDKLLEGLLTILLENAGAERCFLLLENEGRLTVAAEGEPGGEGFKMRQDLPAETHGGISMQVVNYAKRTLGAVVINDAGNDGLFRDDPVLRGRQVKSLLCVPLVRSKNITGMIYLENSLTAHAFPPGKTEMVRLLSAQAAIALENAILYEKARNAEQESYNQCQEIQGQYEELEAMYEEMESMNQELARTSKDLMDANDSLARSQERYRLLAENLTDVIWTTDTNLKFTYISPSIERLAGYTPEEFLSLGLEEMMTPESLVLVTETIAGEMERNRDRGGDPGRSRIVELEQKRKDGSTVWIEVKASFLFDERGSPSMVLGVSRDITERRKALEKIRNTKNYLDGVLNSLPSMLIAVDAGGYILQWNSACEESLGIRRQDAVMTLLWETVPFMETYRDIVSGVIEHTKPVELHRESVFLREEKFFDIAMYPLSLAESGGAVVRIDDVTGRVRIEQVMVQTEKMLSLGGLAAGMAHEINNPLGGIMLGAQNILRRLSGDLDKNREAAAELGITMEQLAGYHEKRGVLKLLEGIVSLGGRASQIVMNMLNFSRHSSVEKTPVDLAELLDQTIELASHDYDLKKKYDFRHITIVREFAPDLPPVPCNRTEIEQVLLNLLKNSAQAMRENRGEGYEPLINLRLYRKDGHALIEVQDNGPGMDLKTRRRIFEPFFTTKDVGVGTGLGLSVSYYIITSNHRGAISVESEPGKGATFRISLPVCPEEKER